MRNLPVALEPMKIDKQLTKLEEIIQWQDQKIHGTQITIDSRIRIISGLIDLALEHEKSIGILIARRMFGSVFALVRPLYEAYIKALWFRYCANEKEIENFKKGKLDKTFNSLITDVEKIEGYDVNVLSDIKAKNWPLMNDFTHGGISQAYSRSNETEIGADYPVEDVLGAINFSITIGLWATMEIANITKNEKFALEILEKSKEYINNGL